MKTRNRRFPRGRCFVRLQVRIKAVHDQLNQTTESTRSASVQHPHCIRSYDRADLRLVSSLHNNCNCEPLATIVDGFQEYGSPSRLQSGNIWKSTYF